MGFPAGDTNMTPTYFHYERYCTVIRLKIVNNAEKKETRCVIKYYNFPTPIFIFYATKHSNSFFLEVQWA
jgi:hypothetical protein